MRTSVVSIIGAGLISVAAVWFFTAENIEAASEEPSMQTIQGAIKEHLVMQTDANGNINIDDPKTGASHKLEYVSVHNEIKKNGDSRSICVDFVDRNTDERIDVDYAFQQEADGSIKVLGSSIHKVNDEER